MRNQMCRMVLFVGAELARGLGAQLPDRYAVRTLQVPGGQRLADQGPDALCVHRLGGEKHSQREGFTG